MEQSDSKTTAVKHFAVRLPTTPDFTGEQDESAGLTRLRAMTELLTGKRITVHALICEIVDQALLRGFTLPIPKLETVQTKASVERIDVRLNQAQINILDALRDQLTPQAGILDLREYYIRSEVIRELIKQDKQRVEQLYLNLITTTSSVSGPEKF